MTVHEVTMSTPTGLSRLFSLGMTFGDEFLLTVTYHGGKGLPSNTADLQVEAIPFDKEANVPRDAFLSFPRIGRGQKGQVSLSLCGVDDPSQVTLVLIKFDDEEIDTDHE